MRIQATSLGRTGALGLLLVFVLALAGPAAAHHRLGHEGGQPSFGQGKPGGGVSEDNDSDGVRNNIRDDGDNKHPSGKDRSVEHGGSGDQGKSTSTPDQNGKGPERDIGGTDKPDGPGGADIIDQDGNNGCGNDDDFDDDNEGRCLGVRRTEPSDLPPTFVGDEEDEEVLGSVLERGSSDGDVGGAEVLGLVIHDGEVAAALTPFAGTLATTGGNLAPLLALALVLLASGGIALRAARREI